MFLYGAMTNLQTGPIWSKSRRESRMDRHRTTFAGGTLRSKCSAGSQEASGVLLSLGCARQRIWLV
eukprot:12888472-Prorocentrum_lima.AAC.1